MATKAKINVNFAENTWFIEALPNGSTSIDNLLNPQEVGEYWQFAAGNTGKYAEVKDDLIAIILESELSRNIWNQSQNLTSFTTETTLEDVKNFSQNLEISPSMKLVLAQTLLEVIQGSLIIQENSSGKAQIECLLPLVNGKGV
jgi:hypothetical protein